MHAEAQTTRIRVDGRDELTAALESATDGTVIELAAGEYGRLALEDYHVDVTLISDPDAPAVFSQMELDDVSGMTIEGATFRAEYTIDTPLHFKPFQITDSADIEISGALFEGGDLQGTGSDQLDDLPGGNGLIINGSQDVTLSDSEIHTFNNGIKIGGSTGTTITGTEIHDLRSDGIKLSQVTDTLIEGNHIHSRRGPEGPEVHPDMIQLMSRSADDPTTGLTIRGNVFDIAEGDWYQAIYLNNRAVLNGAGDDMVYRDFVIEQNVVMTAGSVHGITVGHVDGLAIRNNAVLSGADGAEQGSAPRIWVAAASSDVVIENNLGAVAGVREGSDWQVRNNIGIQNEDPGGAFHYGDVFIGATGQLGGNIEKFLLQADGLAARNGIGPDMLRYDANPDAPTPLVMVVPDEADPHRATFDATFSAGPDGPLHEAGARFVWRFEDGGVMEGPVVTRTFAEAGTQAVELTVLLEDGGVVTTDAAVAITGIELVSFDAVSGALVASGDGSGAMLHHAFEGIIDLANLDQNIQISADVLVTGIDRGSLEIDISAITHSPDGNPGGELFRQHGGIQSWVTDDGEIGFRGRLEDGQRIQFETSGADLTSGGVRDIVFRYDEDDAVTILVDGMVVGAVEIEGALRVSDDRSLVLGGAFGHTPYDGLISDFTIRSDPNREESSRLIAETDRFVEAAETAGQSIVWGDAESDILWAHRHGSLVVAEDGDDVLRTRGGDDALLGGEGADRFVFDMRQTGNESRDVLLDLDFSEGDWFRLDTREAGTFEHGIAQGDNALRVSRDGSSVFVRDAADLRDLMEAGEITLTDWGVGGGTTLEVAGRADYALEIAGLSQAEILDGL